MNNKALLFVFSVCFLFSFSVKAQQNVASEKIIYRYDFLLNKSFDKDLQKGVATLTSLEQSIKQMQDVTFVKVDRLKNQATVTIITNGVIAENAKAFNIVEVNNALFQSGFTPIKYYTIQNEHQPFDGFKLKNN